MMNHWQIATRSLFYFWRSNLAIALGVAAATAVLTGALIVGSSMRHSLKQLTLDRLGRIDEILVSDGFFGSQLVAQIQQTDAFQSHYSMAVPAILFNNGTVQVEAGGGTGTHIHQATNVNVLGVPPQFWNLGSGLPAIEMSGSNVVINQQLYDRLVDTGSIDPDQAELTLRIPKPTLLPTDSALGKQDDLIESIVGLRIAKVLPNRSLGRFGLHPTQAVAENIYVPIELLQDALRRSWGGRDDRNQDRINAIFFAGLEVSRPPAAADSARLKSQIRPQLADYGFTLKRARPEFDGPPTFDYWSLSSDRMVLSDTAVDSIQRALPKARPVFTYLANDIRLPDQSDGIPFSMIASIDFGQEFCPVSAESGKPIRDLQPGEIILNEWAARDLGAGVGTLLKVKYFEPETTHGQQVEKEASFKVADIAALTEPAEPFRVRRRREIVPARFAAAPTLANDPDLTPMVRGVTDAETIENWDLPFETADKIRPEDDDYWEYYRTTPKAFVTLGTGQQLWHSRFGRVTSFRIPAQMERSEIADRILNQLVADETHLGFELVPIKRNGLKASSGSTPFDLLFLGLSMFVIAAALILVSLLFRLGLQARAAEIGLLRASGYPNRRVISIWLREMSAVCAVGAALGIVMGIGYAAFMIFGLKTWWLGAISQPFLELSVDGLSLLVGALSGLLICVLTIWLSLFRARRQPVRELLVGRLESAGYRPGRSVRPLDWIAMVLLLIAIGLSVSAGQLSGDAQAGSFMGSGFFVLVAILLLVYRWLKRESREVDSQLGLYRLAVMNAKRNALRSTLTIGLVAVASFLIVAVSSFRLTPSEEGTAGFDWVAESSQPIVVDLNSSEDRQKLISGDRKISPSTEILSLRFKPGEDASCNNVYQSSQPRVIGISPGFMEYFDDPLRPGFAWAATDRPDGAERSNPWRMLNRDIPQGDSGQSPIPVVIDKNTANYSLKIFSIGKVFDVNFDTGESVQFQVVGFLNNTILQGSLLISERHFKTAFPYISGYRFFLVREAAGESGSAVEILEDALVDQGFDARSATDMLTGFMAVQNTYLSTFQSLGALGLLLGTFGLASIQVRNVIERREELGLMRAVGFSQRQLSRMVFIENAWLLMMGMGAGILAAICATIPHFVVGNASVPWLYLGLMFAAIVVVGFWAGGIASRQIGRLPLLDSLRA